MFEFHFATEFKTKILYLKAAFDKIKVTEHRKGGRRVVVKFQIAS